VLGHRNAVVVIKLVVQQWITSFSGSIHRTWRRGIDIQSIVTKNQYTEYGDDVSIHRIWWRNIGIQNMVTKYRHTE